MQNSEDRKWLYENLAKRGYDIGTQDEFERSLDENDDDAQWYHKKATEIGLQVGDYNDFDSLFRNKAPQPIFSATATPFKQNNSVAPTPSEKPEEEYIRGFGKGVKQGTQQLAAGVKYAGGEALDLISETSKDNADALAALEQMQAEGRDVVQETKTDAKSVLLPLLGHSGSAIDMVARIFGKKNPIANANAEVATDRTIRKALKETGGDVEAAKALLAERANEQTTADVWREEAAATMNEAKPTKGFGAWVGNMVPQMAGTLTGLGLSAVTKSPVPAQILGLGQMGALTASTAGASMKEARDAGATTGEVWATGLADAAIEFATEAIPFKGYISPLVNQMKSKTAKVIAEAVADAKSPARKEMQDLLEKANEKLGGKLFTAGNAAKYMDNVLKEGVSEFTAEALQTMTPLIYEDRELYPLLWEALGNGLEGAKAGIFMGGVLGGASHAATNAAQRDRRKEQGFVNVAEVKISEDGDETTIAEVIDYDDKADRATILVDGKIMPLENASKNVVTQEVFTFEEFDRGQVDMEHAESYERGRNIATPQEKNDALNDLVVAEEEMRRIFGLPADTAVEDFIGDDPITFAQQQRDLDPEVGQAVLNFVNTKATYDGVIDGAKERIATTVAESDALIDSHINKSNGLIHPATLKGLDANSDRKVYIISGNVKRNDDGSIDRDSTDESLIVMDEAGKVDFVDPKDILSVDEALDPEAEKATARETISNTIVEQTDREMRGVLPFNVGDTYTLLDDQSVQHSVQILADNGDNTIQMVMDNEAEATTAPKEMVQQMADAYNIGRANAKIAEKKAQSTIADSSSEETTPMVENVEPKKEVPVLKNGQPDFNAMDAEMFVNEYASRYGEESATKIARKNISSAREEIAKIDKKIDDITDPNQMQGLFDKKAEAEARLNRYVDILDRMGMSEDANETEADQKTKLRNEAGNKIVSLFPDGLPNVESFILADIATGNRVRWSDKETNGAVTSRGLGAELGLSGSNKERVKRLALISNDAMTPEEYAESLRERLDAAGIRYDETALRDDVINTYASVDTRKGAWEALENIANRANEQEQELMDWEDAQQRIAYEKAKNAVELPAVPDLASIEEEVPEVPVELGASFDENINETENIFNDERSTENADVPTSVSAEDGIADGDQTGIEMVQGTGTDSTLGDRGSIEAGQGSNESNVGEGVADVPSAEVFGGAEESQVSSNDDGGSRGGSNQRKDRVLSKEVKVKLSENKDEFGKPFVLSSDGSIDFGFIEEDSDLTVAPIRLSLGENYVDDKGRNHGYGLLHIEAGHGAQIRNAGYETVEDFVKEVATNYTDIREGGIIADNQTYLLEVSDDHNNTLFIQLSRDGNYWNINSAGIFKKKYSRNKPKVYTRPAVGRSTNTDASGVDNGQSMGVTAPAGNSPQTSESKDTTTEPQKQEIEQKNVVSEQEADISDEDIEALWIKSRDELWKPDDETGQILHEKLYEAHPEEHQPEDRKKVVRHLIEAAEKYKDHPIAKEVLKYVKYPQTTSMRVSPLTNREEMRRKPLRARAKMWEAKVGVPVHLIETFEEVPTEDARKAILDGEVVTAWVTDGEVYLYVPYLRNRTEVDKTYIHEVVAHVGMKRLLGKEGYRQFCERVYNEVMTEADRKFYDAYPNVKNHAQAADEYIAHLSETTDMESSIWQKVVRIFRDALRVLGIETALTNKDIQDLLRDSYQNLANEENVSISESEATRLRINDNFNRDLKRQIDDVLPKGYVYELGMPSEVLRSAGIPNLPIEMASQRLIHKSNQVNHPFDLSEVMNLPNAIQNPLAVFDSATDLSSNVILTELKQGNKNFVVAIRTNREQGRIRVNSIRSIHPRTTSNIIGWINDDLMRYADKDNLLTWIQEKIKTRDYLNSSNPADVRKSLVSATKIVNDFDNPTIVAEKNEMETQFRIEKPSLVGLHNISEEKLRKALKMGGLANPSVAVIDVDKSDHTDYGDYSLVLSKNMVDARLGKNAGTWSGDAWTPTYPQVTKRISKDKNVSRFYKDISAMPEAIRGKVRLDFDSFRDGRSANALAYWYLFEKGSAPELVNVPARYPEEIANAINEATNGSFSMYGLSAEKRARCVNAYIAYKYGGDRAAYDAEMDARKKRLENFAKSHEKAFIRKKAQEDLDAINEYGFDYDEVSRFIHDVEWDVRHKGEVDADATIKASMDYITENNLGAEYDAWRDNLDERYGIKEYIFDGYTNSGTPRYLPHTIENASKWMKKQGRQGAVATFPSFGTFVAVSIPKMTTLDSIRKRKNSLGKSKEEYDAFREKWENVYYELGKKLQPDAKGFDDYGYWRLIEAVGQRNPKEYIKKQYNIELSKEDTNTLNEMLDAIRNEYPARYFETKFERPINIREFVGAVVPENIPSDIEAELLKAGLNIYKYDPQKEGSRREATLDAVDSDNIRFRVVEPAPTFYSNAERVVGNVRQEKATPEQWLKMIEKNGGLKAGEDKWLGLSDWLKSSDKKTLTKDEVLDFIKENQIQIEEVVYGDVQDLSAEDIQESGEFAALVDSLTDYEIDENGDEYPYINRERYQELRNGSWNFSEGFSVDYWGEGLDIESVEAAAEYLGISTEDRNINETRLKYTTDGLENKREIALVVPTIESWNTHDDVHFGDAGNGRAIAWVRFGEAKVPIEKTIVKRVLLDAPYKDVNGNDVYKIKETRNHFIVNKKLRNGERKFVPYVNDKPIGTTIETAAFDTLEEASMAMQNYYNEHPYKYMENQRVLVIDEVQSNRHQEGREKGYRPSNIEQYLKDNGVEVIETGEFYEFHKNGELDKRFSKGLLHNDINRAKQMYVGGYVKSDIPSAPFEKNWAELAMKRMLRYAAENGFDKIAWTTGNQQAERYNLGDVMQGLTAYKTSPNTYYVIPYNNGAIGEFVKEYTEKELAETFGKEIAVNIITNAENATEENPYEMTGDDLRIGGSGMKAFYDQMIPSFMNKYGKKWGVKVGEVTMPNLVENNTMHSIDVTDAMRESVMQGQPMFRIADYDRQFDALQSEYDALDKNDVKALNEWREKKTSAVRDYLTHIKDRFGMRSELIVFNGADEEQMRDAYNKVVASYEANGNMNPPTYEAFKEKSLKPDVVGVYRKRGNVTTFNAVADNLNDKMQFAETMFHENAHRVSYDLYTTDEFETIWNDAKKSKDHVVKEVEKLYAKHNNVQKGKEYIAKAVGYLANKQKDSFMQFMRGEMPVDELLKKLRSNSKIAKLAVEETLNVIKDEYRVQVSRRGDTRRMGGVGYGSDLQDVGVVLQGNGGAEQGGSADQDSRYRVRVLDSTLADMVGEESYNKFLDGVFRDADDSIRREMVNRAMQNGLDFRTATQEYLANLVNENVDSIFLSEVKDLYVGTLEDAGIEGGNISDNDLRYALWRNNLQDDGIFSLAEDVVMRSKLGVGNYTQDSDTRFRVEREQIIANAKADGTYLKAPNGKDTNLTPKQWVTVRTDAFKKWFGDWEKAARIEKLHKSKDAKITGNEIEASDDLKQYKKNAQMYGRTLQGQYTNADTGTVISLQRGRHNGGINEVLQHNYKDVAHLQSVAAIPQIIENGIYIESQPNTDTNTNPNVTEYQLFVCGLKIGGEDYTVLAKVAVDNNGNRYYDHNLVSVEKGKLIDIANNEQSAISSGFGTTPDTKSTTNSQRKYKELISLLQTNSSKIVDANGEPKVVYHETDWDALNADEAIFDTNRSGYDSLIFFADKPSRAGLEFGKYKIQAFLNVRKPKVSDTYIYEGDVYYDSKKYDGGINNFSHRLSNVTHEFEESKGFVVTVKNPSQIKSAEGNTTFDANNDDIRFRVAPSTPVSNEAKGVRKSFDDMVKRASYQMKEAGYDRYQSIKEFMRMASKAHGVNLKNDDVKEIVSYENPYIALLNKSSINEKEVKAWEKKYYIPIIDAIQRIYKDGKGKIAQLQQYFGSESMDDILNNYTQGKHGLERNRDMAVRASLDKMAKATVITKQEAEDMLETVNADLRNDVITPTQADARRLQINNMLTMKKYDEKMVKHQTERWDKIKDEIRKDEKLTWEQKQRTLDKAAITEFGVDLAERDYSGLGEVFRNEGGKLEDSIEAAYKAVVAFEEAFATEDLWKAIKAANDATLEKAFRSSIINRETYDNIRSMYDYYIPLRGFEADTTEDVYGYLNNEPKAFSMPVKRANGRASKAEFAIPHILQMAHSAILQGNNNLAKLTMANFAQHYPSDLVKQSNMWIEYDETSKTWVAKYPDIPKDASVEDVSRIVDDFNANMEELAKANPNKYRQVKGKMDVPYIVPKDKVHYHQIPYKRNGVDHVLTVSGSPRLAYAMNGEIDKAPSVMGKVGEKVEGITRFLSGMYTQYNPDFMVSNFFRDGSFVLSTVPVREDAKYAANYYKNYFLNNPLVMTRLFNKYEAGTLNRDNYIEAAFEDFLKHGGETGYAILRDVEETKNKVKKDIHYGLWNKAKALIDRLGIVGRGVESSARFAAYLTSREAGRSIARSVYDAKEVSVNFNRKGAGAVFNDLADQNFWGKLVGNTAGIFKITHAFFNAGVQGLAGVSKLVKHNPVKGGMWLASPFLLGVIIASLYDDDDEYYNLTETVRRQNIMIRMGDDYVSIPLAIELRALYGIGEMMVSLTRGKEDLTQKDVAYKIAEQILQAFPINVLEGNGGFDALMPTAYAIVQEVMVNEDWQGIPIYREDKYTGDEYKPEWRMVNNYTDERLVAASKLLSKAAGGDYGKRGQLEIPILGNVAEINPAVVQHIMEGLVGGPMSFFNKVMAQYDVLVGDKEFEWRNVPFMNRLVKDGGGKAQERMLNREYRNNEERYEEMHRQEVDYQKFIKDASNSEEERAEYQRKLDELRTSEEYNMLNTFHQQSLEIDKMYKAYKDQGILDEQMPTILEAKEKANAPLR